MGDITNITSISVGTLGSIGFTSTSDTSKFSTSGAQIPLIFPTKKWWWKLFFDPRKVVKYTLRFYKSLGNYCSIMIHSYIYLYYVINILSCLISMLIPMIRYWQISWRRSKSPEGWDIPPPKRMLVMGCKGNVAKNCPFNTTSSSGILGKLWKFTQNL